MLVKFVASIPISFTNFLKQTSTPIQYVLPTVVQNTHNPRILGIPKLKSRILTQVIIGPQPDEKSCLSIECRNPEGAGKANLKIMEYFD